MAINPLFTMTDRNALNSVNSIFILSMCMKYILETSNKNVAKIDDKIPITTGNKNSIPNL